MPRAARPAQSLWLRSRLHEKDTLIRNVDYHGSQEEKCGEGLCYGPVQVERSRGLLSFVGEMMGGCYGLYDQEMQGDDLQPTKRDKSLNT